MRPAKLVLRDDVSDIISLLNEYKADVSHLTVKYPEILQSDGGELGG